MADRATMPRPKSDRDAQVTIALPGSWLDEAQRVAEGLSQPGLVVTRADVLRMAMRRGLDVLVAEGKRDKRR